MTLISFNTALHNEGQEAVIGLAAQTHAGMAHWAGSGPPGLTCRECHFWNKTGRWSASLPGSPGEPKPSTCNRYKQLMCKRGESVPHDAAACKFFREAEKPQPLERPKKESFGPE